MKTLVTITTYNEERNISSVLKRIPEEYDILVVDDGSSDKTVDIIENLGYNVAVHPVNLGQGTAVITSFKIGVMEGYDILIEMDGDGQHDPGEIPKFIEVFENTDFDIVIGSRILGKNYQNAPLFRKMFLPYFSWIISKASGYRLTDYMCEFRAFRVNSLKKVLHDIVTMFEPQYIAAEMLIRFARADLTIKEIPIHLKDRLSGKSRKGFIRYGLGVSRAILKTYLDRKK